MNFLKEMTPHPDTRIVVSCLPDEKDAAGRTVYWFGCDTQLRALGVPRVEVTPLSAVAESAAGTAAAARWHACMHAGRAAA